MTEARAERVNLGSNVREIVGVIVGTMFRLLAPAAAFLLLFVENAHSFSIVQGRDPDAELEYVGYLMSHFIGENLPNGEQVYFSLSVGNDPLNWRSLNDGLPVLESTMGETGVRDPTLIRAHNNSGFYLIATDLKFSNHGNWDSASRWGSRSLNVWESPDLVNWSPQNLVEVAPVEAGQAWAPAAYYDDSIGAYVAFWASKLYDDETHTGNTYDRMFFGVTPDFSVFGEAQAWFDFGGSAIDATVIKEGDTYYRYTKYGGGACGGPLYNDKSTVLTSRDWEFVADCIGNGIIFAGGEGPTAFQDNLDPERWFLFIDEEGGRGYVPLTTKDLDAATWVLPDEPWQMPPNPRHGSVMAVTAEEYEALLLAYQPNEIVVKVESLVLRSESTFVGPDVLPESVAATFADGSVRDVRVMWEEFAAAADPSTGSVVVRGELQADTVRGLRAEVEVVFS